jgi:hypothetical protein
MLKVLFKGFLLSQTTAPTRSASSDFSPHHGLRARSVPGSARYFIFKVREGC